MEADEDDNIKMTIRRLTRTTVSMRLPRKEQEGYYKHDKEVRQDVTDNKREKASQDNKQADMWLFELMS